MPTFHHCPALLAAGANLAANFDKHILGSGLVQQLDHAIDRVAFGDGGQIDLQFGNRFTEGRRVHSHRQLLVSQRRFAVLLQRDLLREPFSFSDRDRSSTR